jgi:uncharacterized protein (UPF0261 family)
MPVAVIATLDTKGLEAAFVRERLNELDVEVLLIDVGCLGEPCVVPDIDRRAVFEKGGYEIDELRKAADRGRAVAAAADSVAKIVLDLFKQGELEGIIGLGGSAGTTIATAAMRALPIGVPKVMVSTLASGQVRPWVGDKDVLMLNSVVDISGINRISRLVLGNAAAAMAGMNRFPPGSSSASDRPVVAATMFGVTTPCVERARQVLEAAGYEVLVFHATGNGGQAMETLIADGLIAGVLDITTTELADELVGGILTAGPDRLTAAATHGVPQVVSVGALDMVNFGPRISVPEKFRGRKLYEHNATVTLMRTTPEENERLGAEIARKLAPAGERAVIYVPLLGVSAIDREGQPFDDPVARRALFEAIRARAVNTRQVELNLHINDPAFAEAAARELIELMTISQRRTLA